MDSPDENTPLYRSDNSSAATYTSNSELGRCQKMKRLMGHEQTGYWVGHAVCEMNFTYAVWISTYHSCSKIFLMWNLVAD